MSIRCIVITPQGRMHVIQLAGYDTFRDLVGGDLESIVLEESVHGYCNEDGIALGLPRNDVATKLVQHFIAKDGRTLLPGDYIKGTLIICGLDDEGEWAHVPMHFVDEALGLAIDRGI